MRSLKVNREEFEKWYISKYLRIMKDAESEVLKLRNEYGGYDDENIDVAWEAWKHCNAHVQRQRFTN